MLKLGAAVVALVGTAFGFDDRNHNITEIAHENGFQFEAYQVQTEDGYLLGLHRIPSSVKGAPVAYFQHGIEDCSEGWVMNDAQVAPPFVLARLGYDVWLGNNRGNIFSEKHVSMTPNQKEFWQFDFEDMGTKDVPAMTSFIKKMTGVNKMTYIGHSEGTTQFFIGASMKPDFFDQTFNLFVALAPVVRLDNVKNPLMKYASQFNSQLKTLVESLHLYNLMPRGAGSAYLADACKVLP